MGPPRTAESPIGAPAASPATYTSRRPAAEIRAGRAALEGERKQVTVLFADVVGSTELIQHLDAEDAQQLLDGVLQVMMDAIHQYEGTVSRLMGDGLMALFGAPIAHEDHALRACYAALTMQEAARHHAEQVLRPRGVAVTIRIGLGAGEVIARTVRDDLHTDYTAMGQTVHLAARMEQLAKPDTITLTPGTLALVEGYVRARSLGPVPVKGLAEPIEVFELLGAEHARTRLQAAASRGLSRFVGRQAEIEALHQSLVRAGDGHGQIVALVGEPGVGKSRLVRELVHSHRTQGWTILEGGAVSTAYPEKGRAGGSRATAYLPVVDLLRRFCRIEARDDARTVREKLAGKLLRLNPALEATLPALLALLDALPAGVPISDSSGDVAVGSGQTRPPVGPAIAPPANLGPPTDAAPSEEVAYATWEMLDPSVRRRQTIEALKRLLLALAQEQPLLLIFEDLHWLDAETQAVLDSLVESLPTARILLLVNYRPEYTHTWGNKTYYSQLRIDPLGEAVADELLRSLLGDDPSLEPVKALLLSRTEGNPFFLEECVRSLVESGALVGDRGACRLPGPLTTVRVPATVQAVLAARIDRLPPDVKDLLQTAAVIGKDVPEALLRAVADRDGNELRREIAALQEGELLYEARLFPERAYTFKHALTHEVAYGSVLQARRRALHARAVAAIDQVYAGRLDEQAERRAYHAVHGELWEEAVRACHLAGEKARERSAYRAAVELFEQALVALGHLAETDQTRATGIEIRWALRIALSSLGEYQAALVQLVAAERLADTLGDRSRQGWTAAMLSGVRAMSGDLDRAAEDGRRALAIGDELGDARLRIVASFHIGRAAFTQGRLEQAKVHLTRAIAMLRGDLAREHMNTTSGYLACEARMYLVGCLAYRGEFDDGELHAREMLRIAEAVDHPLSIGVGWLTLGRYHAWRGDATEAIAPLERGLAHLETWGLEFHQAFVAAFLGYAYALAGLPEKATPFVERTARSFVGGVWSIGTLQQLQVVGSSLLLLGQVDDAARLATQCLQLSRDLRMPVQEGWALHLLGAVGAHGDRADLGQAERHYHAALTLAESSGMRPLGARCHLGLGTLHRRAGRPDVARAELLTAVTMLREMRMTHWLREAENALDQLATSRT